MEIKLENNIPMPGDWVKQQQIEQYPFAQMEVGDSFLVDSSAVLSLPNFRSLSYKSARFLGFKFATRKNSKGDIRVWRIA